MRCIKHSYLVFQMTLFKQSDKRTYSDLDFLISTDRARLDRARTIDNIDVILITVVNIVQNFLFRSS